MKILIIADQEGCFNITCKQSNAERNQLMQSQVAKVLHSIDPDWAVTILDCHDNGLNLFPLRASFPKINIISQLWNFNINEGYDCAIFIGFHVASGEDSIFAHTFRTEIENTLLNNMSVGEVSLIALWLQSYNIPVLWVNGEDNLKAETERIGLNFISNKELFENNFYFTITSQKHYDDTFPVKIKLVNDKLLDAFPSAIFNIRDNHVIFKNIEEYLMHLSEISIFLNAARNYYIMYLKKLVNRIKWNYTQTEIELINDKRLVDLIFNTSLYSLRNDDLSYIETFINQQMETKQ